MPRFSARAKEIWDEIWYYSDIEKANKLKEDLRGPLDIAFGKLFIAYYYGLYQQHDKFLAILTEIEDENQLLKDQFLQFMINVYYCRYYKGWNNPIVNKKQAKIYLDKIERSVQDIDYKDEWEKYYCIGWHFFSQAMYENFINGDPLKAIELMKKCIEAVSHIPEEGEMYSAVFQNNIGYFYLESGNFEEAEKSLILALDVHKRFNSIDQSMSLNFLCLISFIRGDLQTAKEMNMARLKVAKSFNNSYEIFRSLTAKGDYLYQEGNYDEAIKAHSESLVYRKLYGEPLEIFWGYFQMFDLYYRRYKLTMDKTFLTQAKHTLDDLRELRENHSDNQTIVNFTNYAHALVLKFGSIRKKGKAIDIMEKLMDTYPNDNRISLSLLELLFEDVMQSEDQDTINQIDELMMKIRNHPLRNSPQAIFDFISQQIFLAKYNYYIQGDPTLGLEILSDAKDFMNTHKLDNLVLKIDAEIQVLRRDITKWDNVDMSVQDRIKLSEFTKYIEEALKMADKQV